MAIHKVNARVTLHTSVSHIGDTVGIDAMFHRVKIMLPDGEPEQVPTITGNSLRGQLRDAAAKDMLDYLDLPPLDLDTFYMLFSGGSLTKTGGSKLDIEAARRLRRILPMLSLFGAASGNHIMPGKLSVGMFIPIAQETLHIIPEGVGDGQLAVSVYDMMQTESYTRRDDAKSELLDSYREADSEATNDAPQQMRYQIESMAAGSRLYWHFALDSATGIEAECFLAALRRWAEQPILGGKKSVGHGLCEIEFDNGWHIRPQGHNLPEPTLYRAHLDGHKDEIRGLLYG